MPNSGLIFQIAFTAILSLAIFTGGIVGAYYAIKTSQTDYITCNVTKILNRDCREANRKGHVFIYMTQYVEINDNYTAAIDCGSVSNCETSQCNPNIVLYNTYGCMRQSHNSYILPSYPYGMYCLATFAIIASILIPTVLIIITYYTRNFLQTREPQLFSIH